jgi:hypothetical protein
MPQIDRAGLYKGEIKDFGISVTNKAKLPQFIATFLATELFNEAEETWEDWSQYEQTITGYFVLVTLDAHGQVVKCLNYDQLVEAVGWDGETYSSLAAMDLKGKRVQFRVAEDVYEGNTTLKVNWIAAEDAQIGLRKLSEKDLTNLDAKYGAAPAKKKTAATPKNAKKASPKKAAPKPPEASGKVDGKSTVKPCTEDEAYQACVNANEKSANSVPNEVLDDYWVTHVTEIAGDTDNVTDDEWPKIRDAVLGDIDIPF